MDQMRTNFLPILENGGVDLVFCGHSHAYERSKLLNGHYGVSTTFSAATHVIQTGGGRDTNGVGAYHKPDGLGEKPIGNRGTIYTVAGSSGKVSTGTTNHPAMFYSALSLGSVVLDFSSNRLDALFLRETGATNDYFTIIKDGTFPPRISSVTNLNNGSLQATILTRGFRTNVVEATTNLTAWMPLLTNVTTTNATFNLTVGTTNGDRRFFRVKRP
jgi:hypothetical protein